MKEQPSNTDTNDFSLIKEKRDQLISKLEKSPIKTLIIMWVIIITSITLTIAYSIISPKKKELKFYGKKADTTNISIKDVYSTIQDVKSLYYMKERIKEIEKKKSLSSSDTLFLREAEKKIKELNKE